MPTDPRIEEAPAEDREMLLRILAFSGTTDPRLVLAVLRTGKKPPEKMTDPQLRAAVKVAVLTVKSDVAGAVGKAREQGLMKKTAAKVGTDTASVWAIAPENLARLLKDKDWAKTFHETYVAREPKEGDHARLDVGVREHGGAVFHTGGDGIYDVRVVTEEGEMPIVKEMGYLPPYGTKDYKLAADAQHGPWKVDAAKLRQLAPKIADALAKEIAKLGVPTDALKKTTWFRDLPVPQAKRDKLDGIVWVKGKALFPEDDSEVLWDMFRETASAANKILLDKKVIGPLAE